MGTFIVFIQHILQVRCLVENLPCKLRVGKNPPIPIVLQGAGVIYSRSHTFTPFSADSTTCISSASIFKSLTDSIILLPYLLSLTLSVFDFSILV